MIHILIKKKSIKINIAIYFFNIIQVIVLKLDNNQFFFFLLFLTLQGDSTSILNSFFKLQL